VTGYFSLARTETGLLSLGAQEAVGEGVLDLTQAHCRVLKDDINAWRKFKRYDITGFKFDLLEEDDRWNLPYILEWLEKAQGGDFSPQPYEQVAHVQRQMGFAEYAKAVLIAREARKSKLMKGTTGVTWWRRTFTYLYGRLVGFGYRPAWAMNWALGLWLLGTALIFAADSCNGFYRAKESASKSVASASYPSLAAPMYSLEVMIPFLKFHQEDHWTPDHSKQAGKWIQRYLWFHTLAGWLLGTFLLASVTALVRKDA
jgi:hypothetical protein